MATVLINGFGRIGRTLFRILLERPGVEVARINDPLPATQLAYLLQYDTVMGRLARRVEARGESLVVGDRPFAVRHAENLGPAEIEGCEIVVNSSGRNNTRAALEQILALGARRIVVSMPLAPGVGDRTILRGVNDAELRAEDRIISAGSCTAHCFTPLLKLIHAHWPVVAGDMLTIHAYTSAQNMVDGGHGADLRRGRAGAVNIVPTTTEAITAFEQVMPELAGRIAGMAQRVPVINGSNVELVLQLNASVESALINDMVAKAAQNAFKGIVEFSADPLVSSDIVCNPHSAVFDSLLTHSMPSGSGSLARVVAWYDNEWGYASRLAELLAML